jgi:predicted nucleic acid-binding protein
LKAFVVDCSVTMAWYFRDQADAYCDGVLASLKIAEATVPSVWPLEVANVLLIGERRKVISQADTVDCLGTLGQLRISVDEETPSRALGPILSLAREQGLSSYDAAYLELAMRLGLPLATRDGALKKAARAVGVPLVK